MIGADAGTWSLVVVTGALAVFTAFMAFSTRRAAEAASRAASAAEQDIRQGAELVKVGQRQVEVAQRQVEIAGNQAQLAQRSLDVESQPLVVPTTHLNPWNPEHMLAFTAFQVTSNAIQDFPVAKAWAQDGSHPWVVVKVRNIGRGTALGGSEISDVMLDAGGVKVVGELSSVALAPGDQALLVFNGQANSPATQSTLHSWVQIGNAFSVTFRYTDIARHRIFETTFELGTERPDPSIKSVTFAEMNQK